MPPSVIFLLVSIIELTLSSQSSPGHLQPFGSAGPLQPIEEFTGEYPSASKLFLHFLPNSLPFLSRQVLINELHYHLWQSNEQLTNDVSGLSQSTVVVESLKSQERIQMKFTDFLDRYERDSLFLADNVPEPLR